MDWVRNLKERLCEIVGVLFGGSARVLGEAVDFCDTLPWVDPPGEAGGEAIGRILFGKTSASGKLLCTLYKGVDDLPSSEGYQMKSRPSRYMVVEPDFPFGFGLSSSTFELDTLSRSSGGFTGDAVTAKLKVTNPVKHDGGKVIQLNFRALEAPFLAPKVALRDFRRIAVPTGGSVEVAFTIDRNALELVNPTGKRVLEPVPYGVIVATAAPGPTGPRTGSPGRSANQPRGKGLNSRVLTETRAWPKICRDFVTARGAKGPRQDTVRNPSTGCSDMSFQSRYFRAIQVLSLAIALGPVAAFGTVPETETYKGAVTLTFENDLFAGNDSNYTNGLAAAITSAEIGTLEPSNFFAKTARFFSFLPTVGNEGYQNHVGYKLSHKTYTPPDITLPAPLPGDTPYSGILLADVTLYSKTPKSQHTFLLAAGAAGPVTGAEYVQKVIHEILNAPTPMGWDTQLGNEFLLNAGYAYDYRLVRMGEPGGSGFDLSAGAAGSLGNYVTGAQGSATMRFGWDIPDTYGELDLRFGASNSIALAPPPKRWRVYGTLGASLDAIARFLPSDGNTFTDSLSGDRDDFYLSATGGIVVGYRNLVFNFVYVAVFGESDPPDFNGNDYGSIGATWFF